MSYFFILFSETFLLTIIIDFPILKIIICHHVCRLIFNSIQEKKDNKKEHIFFHSTSQMNENESIRFNRNAIMTVPVKVVYDVAAKRRYL